MPINCDAKNSFYWGWLTCFMGLPRSWPGVTEPRPESEFIVLEAFLEGWDTCNETPVDGHPNRLTAFYAEIQNRNIGIYHADEEGWEIDPVTGKQI